MAFLPALAVPLLAGGAAVGAVGDFSQGQYQSQVAKNNAAIAKQNAAATFNAAQTEQIRSDREYAQQEGELIAEQSASGLNLMGRTSTAVRAGLHDVGRQAATDIYRQGASDSRKYLQQAANFKAESKSLKIKSYLDLGGGLLKSASLAGGAKSSGGLY